MEAEVRPSLPPSPSTIYHALQSYPFTSDPDFQAGLTSLISSPTLSPSDLSSTISQAQCFYFARRYDLPPIDSSDYQRWLYSQNEQIACSAAQTQEQSRGEDPNSQEQQHPQSHIAAQLLSQSAPTSPILSSLPPPSYPASFESIVDLITRNQPIPGIEEIPDTILDASLSAPNQTARRRKPWETDDAAKDVEPVLGDAVADEQGKPTGVVGILQPIKKLEAGEGTNPGALVMEASKEEGIATSNKTE